MEYNLWESNDWKDSCDESLENMKILDAFFQNGAWDSITKDAELGCVDSEDFLDEILVRIQSLTFFTENDNKLRADYELKNFAVLVGPFIDEY